MNRKLNITKEQLKEINAGGACRKADDIEHCETMGDYSSVEDDFALEFGGDITNQCFEKYYNDYMEAHEAICDCEANLKQLLGNHYE